jgi:hypothetical protein
MQTFMKFDVTTGRLTETVSALAKPSSEWYIAPKNFNPSNRYERIDGTIKAIDQDRIDAEILAQHKNDATRVLENLAEDERQKFVTQGVGKATVYRQKLHEAEQMATDPDGSYPIIEAEAVARNMSPSDLAELIITKSKQWATIAGMIEAKVIDVSNLIDVSTTFEDVEKALQIDWGLPN